MKLERLIYSRKGFLLTAISRKTAEGLKHYGQCEIPVIYYGLDHERFNPENRRRLREQSRNALDIPGSAFCLLLVGNGWENKGLASLLEALASMGRRDWRLLVVGQDDPGPYRRAIARNGVEEQVVFLPPRPDVEFYYASADSYVGPSLEDAFGLPPLEAMACGLPVIVSSRAGVSEAITDGEDGFILDNPQDSSKLADLIELLYDNDGVLRKMGEAAARTARQYTWDRNAEQLKAIFEQVMERTNAAQWSVQEAR
jgi:UDP-glucose:(heptosyl)LPS alpha-1,3-glucosyltransferase